MSAGPHQPLPAHVYAAARDWPGYFDALAHLPARDTTLAALARATPGFAIDLGCGDGRDTVELLRRGWRVLAIDSSAEGLRRLASRPDLPAGAALETRLAPFEGLTLPPSDLIVAAFSLPFCHPDHFPALWSQITTSLRPGGLFAGQLFGDHDDWASLPDRTHLSDPQARALFRGFDIVSWQEEDRESRVDPVQHPKHWHVFHIVAQKLAAASTPLPSP